MGAMDYAKAFVITAISAYPFVALVNALSHLDVASYEPCDEGCIFIRFFSAGNLPASIPSNMDNLTFRNVSSYQGNDEGWWRDRFVDSLPHFVLVRNGHPASTASLWQTWTWLEWAWVSVGLPVVYPLTLISRSVTSPQQYLPSVCPSLNQNATMSDHCNSDRMRQHITNHMPEQFSLIGYMVGIAGWTICKIVHDWALLAGLQEMTTLGIGLLSFLFQAFASIMAFLWCLGILEVFAARDPDQHCGCYYQVPFLETVASLSTTLLLYYITYDKLRMLCLAVQHGDYLYFTQYDVPFRIAKAAAPSDPTGSMVLGTLRGEAGTPDLPPFGVTFSQLALLQRGLKLIDATWNFARAQVVGAFVVGPVFLRAFMVAFFRPGSSSLVVMTRLAILSLAVCALASTIWVNVHHRLPRLLDICFARVSLSRSARADKFVQALLDMTYSVAFCKLLALAIGLASGRQKCELALQLQHAWTWTCSGAYMFYACSGAYAYRFLDPARASLNIKALSNREPARVWVSLAASHAHYSLGAHGALASEFLSTRETASEFDKYVAPLRGRLLADESSYVVASQRILGDPTKYVELHEYGGFE